MVATATKVREEQAGRVEGWAVTSSFGLWDV